VPLIDPGVVHQHVQAAQVGGGLVHQLLDRLGVGQVAADDSVTAARQRGQHLSGEAGRIPVMHRHPVALAGEGLRDRPADAPGRPGDQDRPGHVGPHMDISLVQVTQFLAVAATPALSGGPMMRNTASASSLVP
jgi:hypothetical protein